MKLLNNITPLEEDFSRWYTDVIKQGNLIEYGKSKGSMIFKPISYGIWENIQFFLNRDFKIKNIQNVYLPLLIPYSYIEKEKDHIEGFAPELATITKVGGKDLVEPFVIRPTSEVLFGELFAKEINSYNDLPIKYNQWANVLRWEKTTNPFLRNREFLWQEGHTAHFSFDEALSFSKDMINFYQQFCQEYLAIETIVGEKTENEKFAGAKKTFTIEAMMKDGKALQSGTSHYLEQNFSKTFNIKYKDQNNNEQFVFQTSWGVSTRLIGAIIMSHGDNRGIVIPPKIAPNQVDILELFANKDERVRQMSLKIKELLLDENIRVRIDSSNKGPGFKAGKSEIEGTPLRLEIGPRDLENNQVTIVRRDTLEKELVLVENIVDNIKQKLNDIQNNLFHNSKNRLQKNIVKANTKEEFKKLITEKKFVLVPFNQSKETEEEIKKQTGATARCIPFNFQDYLEQECFWTKEKTKTKVIFARGY